MDFIKAALVTLAVIGLPVCYSKCLSVTRVINNNSQRVTPTTTLQSTKVPNVSNVNELVSEVIGVVNNVDSNTLSKLDSVIPKPSLQQNTFIPQGYIPPSSKVHSEISPLIDFL